MPATDGGGNLISPAAGVHTTWPPSPPLPPPPPPTIIPLLSHLYYPGLPGLYYPCILTHSNKRVFSGHFLRKVAGGRPGDIRRTVRESHFIDNSSAPPRLLLSFINVREARAALTASFGLVVKASALRAEDPGFESRLRRDFFRGRVIPVT